MADDQVSAWLRSAGLSRFSPRFAAAKIDTSEFLGLVPSALDGLGLESPADRKRLSDLISELRRVRRLPPLASQTPARHTTSGLLHSGSSTNSRSDSGPPATYSSPPSALPSPSTAPLFTPSPPSHVTGTSTQSVPNVRVCVRKRPLSSKEVGSGDRDIISTSSSETLFVHEVKNRLDLSKYVESHEFSFDAVFGEKHTNMEVYVGTARPLVDAFFEGSRCTCFAYGQTGTGKTYTMEGRQGNPGLYLLAVNDVFHRLRNNPTLHVSISFFEIYGSRLHDLLNNRAKLESREDSQCEVRIVGLTECRCSSADEVLDLIDRAAASRSTGVTGANDDSSRSHAVFQLELRRHRTRPPDLSLRVGGDVDSAVSEYVEVGRLSFIDLAGSERGNDTSNSNRLTRLEGAEINKSLLALKECIRAMDQRKDHTPFRGSKLTQVLKASFTGKSNCQTVMIANVSPASMNVEHTLNTLRYSQRVKEMKSTNSDQTSNTTAYTYGVPVPPSRPASLRSASSGPTGCPDQQQDPVPSTYESSITNIHSPENLPLTSDPEHSIRPLKPDGEPASSRLTAVNALLQERRRSVSVQQTVSRKEQLSLAPASSRDTSLEHGADDNSADSVDRLGDRVSTDPRSGRSLRRLGPMSRSMIPTPRISSGRRATLLYKDDATLPSANVPPMAHIGRSRGRSSLMPANDAVSSSTTTDFNAIADNTSVPAASHHRGRRGLDTDGQIDLTDDETRPNNFPHELSNIANPRTRGPDLVRFNTLPSSVQRTSRSKSGAPFKLGGIAGDTSGIANGVDGSLEEKLEDEDVLFRQARAKKSPRKGNRVPFGSRNRRPEVIHPPKVQERRYFDEADYEEDEVRDFKVDERGSLESEAAGGLSDEALHVISLHKEKAEELTKLMREGIELMRAVEDGRVAPASYATKLELNLALSMDVIHTLKTHVASLGAQER
jgi:Kinesin motor domain/SAM domain (Sterile alpha motif)